MAIPGVIVHISFFALLLLFINITAAFNVSSSNNVTSWSSRSVSTTLPWKDSSPLSGASSTASNLTIESNSRHDPQIPATNSNGDYVTSILGYLTETYTYSSTTFTWHKAVISGPTTFVTTFTYTEIEADHYGPIKSSNVPQMWDRGPFMRKGYDYPEDPSSYSAAWLSFTHFGREPACTAAFSSFIATQPVTTEIFTFAKSFTLPDGRDTVGVVYNTVVGTPYEDDACCARCTLVFQSLQMLYWPGPHPQTKCITTSGSIAGNATAWSTFDSGQGGNEADIYATGSDGFVFTSPSVYIGFPLVSASDSCGSVGPTLTSLTLAFAPGELSTMLYYGAPPDDPYGMSAGGFDTDYQPLVELPTKLQQLVPAWSSCYGNAFQGQDPPRVLSPGTRLTPESTTVHANPQPTPAAPSPPIPSLPVETGAGTAQPLSPSPATDPKGIVDPVAGPAQDPGSDEGQVIGNDPGASHGSAADPKAPDPKAADPKSTDPKSASPPNVDPIFPQTPVPTPPVAVVVQDQTITNNGETVNVGGMTVAYQSGSIRVNDEVQQYPTAENLGIVDASPVTVGGLTFSAATPIAQHDGAPQDGTKGSSNGIGSNALPDNDPGSSTYITVGGQTITVQANRIVVAGKTLHPGDPGVTVAGSPVSLGSSEFVIGDHTEIFPPAAAVTTLPSQITVNGQPITLGPNSITIDGTTMKPGDPGITIHGQPVSVGASEVVVGSVTASLSLAAATATRESSYTTLNGEIITLGAGNIAIEGKTLKPGDLPISVDGKLISLGFSNIVVGSVTASLELSGAATTAAPSYITVNGETVTVEASNIVIKGSTLNIGNTGITIDGKMVSLGSSGIVVGGITEAIRFPRLAVKTSSSSYITFGGETVAVGAGSVVIDGATLTPNGPALDLDGTTMSLGSSVLVIGTQTTQLSLPATATSNGGSGEGIGAMIVAGLGGIGGEIFTSTGNANGNMSRSGNGSNSVVPFVGEGATRFGPITVNGWLLWAILLGALVL